MLADAYLPAKGYLHHMDPRAKALLLVAITVVALAPGGLENAAVLTGMVVLACTAGLGLREALRPIRALMTLVVFLVLLTPLFHRDGTVLLSVAGRPILTDRGLAETYRFLCRLVTISEAFYMFFRTTELDAIVAAARWFGLPYVACLVLGVVARLVPTTAALYHAVLDAHSLRRPPARERERGPRAAGAEQSRHAERGGGAEQNHRKESTPVDRKRPKRLDA